jgi:diguanylate cyclase (GGDEF)-like protein
MEKNTFREKIQNYGLIIISAGVAFIYWRIESLHLGDMSTLWITLSLFVGYGVFTQYFINSQKRMAAEIQSLSITDHLTGLYNRRGFMALAEQLIKMAERTKGGALLMLLFADLDKMKTINDELGHSKGDTALIEVASILKKVFRESDIIARVGGDEFAVLGIVTQKSSIRVFESRLQEQIDIHNAYENRDYTIALSVGIACRDPENRYSIDELMSRADKLMYEHKRSKLS